MSPGGHVITITDVGGSRRVVVDGQEYVLLHAAYRMAAEARADERERIAAAIEALILPEKDHCIEEYNAGLTNAASVARGEQQ